MTRREFPKAVKLAAFQRASGHCEECGAFLVSGKFDYDHDKPDWLGGEPTLENCRIRCDACHSEKTHKREAPVRAKSNRIMARRAGVRAKRRLISGSKGTPWKKKMSGEVVRR